MASSLYNVDAFKKIVDDALETLVARIAIDYKLDVSELKTRYFGPNGSLGADGGSGNAEAPPAPKKKGRKKKVQDNVIETFEYAFEGETYLVDKNNNVYTYNVESPTMIGKKLVDGTIKFHKKYMPAKINPLYEDNPHLSEDVDAEVEAEDE